MTFIILTSIRDSAFEKAIELSDTTLYDNALKNSN